MAPVLVATGIALIATYSLGAPVLEQTILSRVSSAGPRVPEWTLALVSRGVTESLVQRVGEAVNLMEMLLLTSTAVFVAGRAAASATQRDGRKPAWSGRRVALVVVAALTVAVLARVAGQYAVAAAAVFVGAIAALAAWALDRTPPAERHWMVLVAGCALLARGVLAIGMHLYGASIGVRAIVLDDESAYDYAAAVLVGAVQIPEAHQGLLPFSLLHLTGPYTTLLMAAYALVGPSPLAGRVLGALLGSLAVVAAAATARALYGQRAGLVTGLTLALIPGLLIWSSMLLKESAVTLLVATVFWGAQAWYRHRGWWSTWTVALALHLFWQLRPYAAVVLGAVLALCLMGLLLLHLRPLHRSLALLAASLALVSVTVLTAATGAGQRLLSDRLDQLVYAQTVLSLSPPPFDRVGADRQFVNLVGVWVGGPIVMVRPGGGQPDTPGMVIATSRSSDTLPQMTYVATVDGGLVQAAAGQFVPMSAMDRGDAIRFVIENWRVGVVSALVGPLNSGNWKTSYLALDLDALAWLALVAVSITAAIRRRDAFGVLPLGYSLALVVVLGALNAIPANLSRERASQCVLGVAIVASPVLASLSDRWQFPGRVWRWVLGTPAYRGFNRLATGSR